MYKQEKSLFVASEQIKNNQIIVSITKNELQDNSFGRIISVTDNKQPNFGQRCQQVNIDNKNNDGAIKQQANNNLQKNLSEHKKKDEKFEQQKLQFIHKVVNPFQNEIFQNNKDQQSKIRNEIKNPFSSVNISEIPKQKKQIRRRISLQKQLSFMQSNYISEDNVVLIKQLLQKNIIKYQNVLKATYYKYHYQYHNKKQIKRVLQRSSRSQVLNLPQLYFKAQRFPFRKNINHNNTTFIKSINYSIMKNTTKKLTSTWLCKLNLKINRVYAYDISQLTNLPLRQLKPTRIISLPSYQCFSPFIQVEPKTSRLMLFSNSNQEVVIYGLKTSQIICRLSIMHQRYNPILYLTTVKQHTILLIIGGFQFISDRHVEGKRYIEMFLLDKWSILLKQRIIKIRLLRIHPLVFGVGSSFDEQGIVLLGGNSKAVYKKRTILFDSLSQRELNEFEINPNLIQLNYQQQKDINESVNKTGLIINSRSILQIINDQNQTIHPIFLSNMVNKAQNLYAGYTILMKSNKSDSVRLILPKLNSLYSVKFINSQIYVKQEQQYVQFQQNSYFGMEISVYKNEIIKIDEQGNLESFVIQKTKYQNKKCPICDFKYNCLIM